MAFPGAHTHRQEYTWGHAHAFTCQMFNDLKVGRSGNLNDLVKEDPFEWGKIRGWKGQMAWLSDYIAMDVTYKRLSTLEINCTWFVRDGAHRDIMKDLGLMRAIILHWFPYYFHFKRNKWKIIKNINATFLFLISVCRCTSAVFLR